MSPRRGELSVSARWQYPRADERWKLQAACVGEDPALWFSHDEHDRYNTTTKALDMVARAICSQCPVAADCLIYAIRLDLRYGTWGGMTERDRAKLTGRRPG